MSLVSDWISNVADPIGSAVGRSVGLGSEGYLGGLGIAGGLALAGVLVLGVWG